MSLQISTICESISALDVDGVRIMDIDQIPENSDPRKAIIFPKPDGFITGFTVVRDSFGGGSTAKMTATYSLNYRLCYAPIGAGRGLFEVYDDMVAKAFLFLDAVIAVNTMTGLIDIQVQNAINFGAVNDPVGNMFHGCDFVLLVTEFIN